MSDTLKTELISVANTAIATFLSVVGVMVTQGPIQWTTAFWMAIVLAAVRAAVKAAIATFVPIRLGGRKSV